MAVTKRTRYEVLKRDNFTCRYCRSTEGQLTIDHVVPLALGGTDDPTNLVAACRDCNAGKSSTAPDAPLVDDARESAVRLAAALAEFSEIRLSHREAERKWVEHFDHEWLSWKWGYKKEDFPRPSDWRETARQFYATGLPVQEINEAIEIACSSTRIDVDNAWRYMCGIVWNKVKQYHDGAVALLEAQESGDGS